jgi:predicted metal-dependent enzyme (double-stranded beta helix superfamily)
MNIFTLCCELDNRLYSDYSLHSCQELLENYTDSDYVSLLCNKTDDYNTYGYKRIHIYGTIHIDVFLIIWRPYSISPLHGHSHGGCIMKVLTNELKETKYNTIEKKICYTSEMKERNISYIEGDVIQHIISNPTDTYSISLQVYARD